MTSFDMENLILFIFNKEQTKDGHLKEQSKHLMFQKFRGGSFIEESWGEKIITLSS